MSKKAELYTALILAGACAVIPGCAEGEVPSVARFKSTATLKAADGRLAFLRSDDVLFEDSGIARNGLVPCTPTATSAQTLWLAEVGRKVMTEPRFRSVPGWCVARATTRRAGSTRASCSMPDRDTSLPNCTPVDTGTTFQAAPAGLEFGDVRLGSSRTLAVRIGPVAGSREPLRIDFFDVDWSGGPFERGRTDCRQDRLLPAGEACTVEVVFTPRGLPRETGELLFHTNDAFRVTGVPLGGSGVR